MNRRLKWLVAPAIAGLLVASGAGSVAASASAGKQLDDATLNGSGSTFQQGFDEAVIAAFKDQQPNVTINYAGGGSGKGRQDFADQIVQFAGTDAPYPAADVSKVKGGEFLYVPTVVAPITVSYNLPDVKKLRLSASTIAKIFSRAITKWNDAAIAKDNPGAKLPDTDITVAHRADSSGTTQNFTSFMTKAAPSDWTLGASSTISWPADTQGGNGNSGVAQIVSSTEGAIGYVDFSDAKAAKLQVATVENAAGKFVAPSTKAASAAVAKTTVKDDLTFDPIYAPGAKAYPITSPTWVLVYKTQGDKSVRAALKAFLQFALKDGQKLAASVDYAALPKSLAKKALAEVKQIG